jgi:F-type H+-transporting ATPase subunit b
MSSSVACTARRLAATHATSLACAAVFTLLPLVALAGDAAAHGGAGGDGHGGVGQQGLIADMLKGKIAGVTAIVVFLTAFALLATLVWPTIVKGLQDRENKIKDEIDAAELARTQAKDALEQYQQSLSQARTQAQAEIDKARAQAQQISAELKAKADVELSAMREKAMRDIDNAKRTAVSEIYDQSTQLATIMAGKILQRNVQVQDGDRIFQESLQQLQAMKN